MFLYRQPDYCTQCVSGRPRILTLFRHNLFIHFFPDASYERLWPDPWTYYPRVKVPPQWCCCCLPVLMYTPSLLSIIVSSECLIQQSVPHAHGWLVLQDLRLLLWLLLLHICTRVSVSVTGSAQIAPAYSLPPWFSPSVIAVGADWRPLELVCLVHADLPCCN